MADIGAAQRRELNLRRQAGAKAIYRRAKLLQFVGGSLSLVFALLAPILLFVAPGLGAILGALAGAWIFATRLLVQPIRNRWREEGAGAQESFDCDVLGLSWNQSLVKRVTTEEIRSASRRVDLDEVRDWYPTTSTMDWPGSVLTCQRSNAVWARREHSAYAGVLIAVAISWALLGIVVSLIHHAGLATYLVAIALPSLPALLDATDLARGHRDASSARAILEEAIDAQLAALSKVTAEQLRENQDRLYDLRRDAPLVPEWFYNLIASRYEDDMRFAADQEARGGKGD